MSDTKNPGDKTISVERKTLGLKRSGGDQGTVRQSFSHGRTKAVVVEKKKRRSRQNFTWSQLSVLERVFETDPLPRQALLQELSYRLDVTPRCVQVWFQNRRQKFKSAHLTQGLQPPTLKNASSWLTSLETLLPDLGPEPQRVTASQLRESAPKVRAAAHAGE